MRSIFSVSLPRSGHHVVEMVLGRLLRSQFHYCEFYTAENCCRKIPCQRMHHHQTEGAIAFMQKSHDHELIDPISSSFDNIMVQVREPIARAMSNYELNLATLGLPHSIAYMRYWLGLEAAYTVGFFEKWCIQRHSQVLVLLYEHLLADPVSYFQTIFDGFGLPRPLFDPGKITQSVRVSSGDNQRFQPRDIRSSRYFDAESIADFQNLVVEASQAVGYSPNTSLPARSLEETRSGSVGLAYEAARLMHAGDALAGLEKLERYMGLPDAHLFARRQRAGMYLHLGDSMAAVAELEAVIASMPGNHLAYIELARLELRRGAESAAKLILDRCLEAADNPVNASRQVLSVFSEPSLTEAARAIVPELPLSREEVIMAFRLILGREPESEAVIHAHRAPESLAHLREILLKSDEFSEKYRVLTQMAISPT